MRVSDCPVFLLPCCPDGAGCGIRSVLLRGAGRIRLFHRGRSLRPIPRVLLFGRGLRVLLFPLRLCRKCRLRISACPVCVSRSCRWVWLQRLSPLVHRRCWLLLCPFCILRLLVLFLPLSGRNSCRLFLSRLPRNRIRMSSLSLCFCSVYIISSRFPRTMLRLRLFPVRDCSRRRTRVLLRLLMCRKPSCAV